MILTSCSSRTPVPTRELFIAPPDTHNQIDYLFNKSSLILLPRPSKFWEDLPVTTTVNGTTITTRFVRDRLEEEASFG
ncbi:hypothetical protein C4D60_Mb06t22200 [Musa balbisiana]|uniref:Uncharacterized protein n=1 Tax=Musa balbisiana TaxID=52838 RepID=A0A4S8IPV8_MUSBA|nr:hypothetical protein C4D60_Mb06t22200 [Musa balbisiana]